MNEDQFLSALYGKFWLEFPKGDKSFNARIFGEPLSAEERATAAAFMKAFPHIPQALESIKAREHRVAMAGAEHA